MRNDEAQLAQLRVQSARTFATSQRETASKSALFFGAAMPPYGRSTTTDREAPRLFQVDAALAARRTLHLGDDEAKPLAGTVY